MFPPAAFRYLKSSLTKRQHLRGSLRVPGNSDFICLILLAMRRGTNMNRGTGVLMKPSPGGEESIGGHSRCHRQPPATTGRWISSPIAVTRSRFAGLPRPWGTSPPCPDVVCPYYHYTCGPTASGYRLAKPPRSSRGKLFRRLREITMVWYRVPPMRRKWPVAE